MPASPVIPVLSYPHVAEAADWLCRAFGFSLRWQAGDHRVQLNIGSGAMAVVQGEGDGAGHSVMVRIEDLDAHYLTAKEHGAHILAQPAEYPYGERQYTARDIGGHVWTFSQTVADVAPEDWGGKSVNL